jgi:hypothetical protein
MSTVWIDFGWIILDVAFCLYVELELHPLTATEWILGAGGLLIAIGSLVASFIELRQRDSEKAAADLAHAKESHELKELLASEAAKNAVRFDFTTQIGFESVRRFQEVTHTTQQPIASSLLAGTEQIEHLRTTVAQLQNQVASQSRRFLSDEQVQILIDELAPTSASESFSVQVTYNSANGEVEEYARQFWGISSIARNVFFGLTPTDEIAMDLKGIVIRVKDLESPPPKARILSRALKKAGIAHKFVSRSVLFVSMQVPDDYVDLGIGRRESKENPN